MLKSPKFLTVMESREEEAFNRCKKIYVPATITVSMNVRVRA